MSIPNAPHSLDGKPRLILHIGPHKTGTTDIQKKLSVNAAFLEQHGLRYIQKFDCGLSVHALADSLSMGQMNRAQEALKEIGQSRQSLILSSENFSRLDSEQVIILAKALEKFETTIVYYIRNPLKRLYSAWQEWVKHGYYYSFPEYMCARLANFSLDPEVNDSVRIDSWIAAFSRLNVRIFNFDATEDVSVQFFNEVLGLTSKEASRDRENKSFAPSYVETIRASYGAYRNLIKLQDRNHELWEMFFGLERSISQMLAGGRYLRTITGSADHGPFAIIESELLRKYSQISLHNGLIFRERIVNWNYIDPNIWINEISLLEKMHLLRHSVTTTLGCAAIDKRLSVI